MNERKSEKTRVEKQEAMDKKREETKIEWKEKNSNGGGEAS